MTAFRNSTALGLRYLETDVRATSDGRVMVFHDATLNRVTDRVGRIRALPYSEVRRAKIGGADNVMLLEELLEEFPDARINIDVKDDHTLTPFVEAIRRTNTGDRICIASFSGSRLRAARVALGPTVATSLAPPEVAGLVAASRLGPFARLASVALPSNAACVQVPVRQGRVPIVTHSFISEAHRRGLAVHVWTINDEPTMNGLLDMGVDGLVTDRPTLLRSVLQSRGQWGTRAIG